MLVPGSFKVASEDGKAELGSLGCVRKSVGLDYPLIIISWGALHHIEICHKQKADQVFDVSDLFKIFIFIIQILFITFDLENVFQTSEILPLVTIIFQR